MTIIDSTGLRPEIPQISPSEEFEYIRANRLSNDMEECSLAVKLVNPVDPMDLVNAIGEGDNEVETREKTLATIRESTDVAIEMLGVSIEEITPAQVSERAKEEFFGDKAGGGIGRNITRVSEVSTIWHRDNPYTPLALDPLYLAAFRNLLGPDDWDMPVPTYNPDNGVIRAGHAGRGISRYITIPSDDEAIGYWQYHPDPVEVRRRGQHLGDIIVEKFSDKSEYEEGSAVSMAAIAGGAAWPDMVAAKELSERRPDLSITLDVFDFDKAAIELGIHRAEKIFGDPEVIIEGNISLIKSGGVTVRFIDQDITDTEAMQRYAQTNNGYDLVEAVGLVEYFEDDAVPFILGGMNSLLKEGGEGVVANMTQYHDFIQILGVIGWHRLRPRTLSQIENFSSLDSSNDWRIELLNTGGNTASYAFARWKKSH